MTHPMRQSLPNRRHLESRKLQTPGGHTVHLSVGYHPRDPETPKEVFYSGGLKAGSDLEYHMQDMCVLISLLLQHQMPPADIAKSLARRETEIGGIQYASIVGWVVDEIRKPPTWATVDKPNQPITGDQNDDR